MTLRERLQDDTTAAMRSGDALRRDSCAWSRTRSTTPRRRSSTTMSDDEVVGVLDARGQDPPRVASRRSAKGGREDLVAKEEAEIAILPDYLPEALTDDELEALVDEAIAETGATSARDLGKVMGWLSPTTRGRADGKVVSGPRRPGARPRGPRRARHGALTLRSGGRPPCSPQQPSPRRQFTRRDAGRLIAASALLVAGDVGHPGHRHPARTAAARGRQAGARACVQAPRTAEYTSDVLTKRQRDAASAAIEPQYDFTIRGRRAVAAQQLRALDSKVAPVDAAFA